MKTRLLVALAFLCLFAAAPMALAGVTYGGGDGTSAEKAVLIKGATEETGVHAEYAWLARHFAGYHLIRQALQEQGKHSYDVLELTTAQGEKKTVWFDITSFFGK